VEWYRLENSGLVHGPVEGSCEHSIEPSSSVKYLGILIPVNKYRGTFTISRTFVRTSAVSGKTRPGHCEINIILIVSIRS
jgi:hypothetical protein